MTTNPNNDKEITDNPPADGISHMSWSKKQNYLCAGSWDNSVKIWEVTANSYSNELAAAYKGQITHDAPVLCTAWSKDGQKVFSAGCDNKAKCWPLGAQPSVVAQHAAPIKAISYIDEMNLLVTGSWDKTLKFWDGRQASAAFDVQLPERVYSQDIIYPVCVTATADRFAIVHDLRNVTQELKRFSQLLKFQSRCISVFPDKTGFALGSIEGRVAIHHIEDRDASKNFAFKCHREGNDIYAVNCISFHPLWGTFATAGSDGTFHFWDKDSKQRLKPFNKCSAPISASSFNMDGTIYAYAVSYDWSKGAEFYNPANKNYIYLHKTPESEIKDRPSSRKR